MILTKCCVLRSSYLRKFLAQNAPATSVPLRLHLQEYSSKLFYIKSFKYSFIESNEVVPNGVGEYGMFLPNVHYPPP